MKESRASVTAAIVAAFRTLGMYLPPEERIADDPYGARLAGKWAERLTALAETAPLAVRALRTYVLYMQVRTRAIDDILLDFLKSGGRQVVLLGAGFDARALRFADALTGGTVFEIDHPATQSKKRATPIPTTARIEYISFDFEAQPMSDLVGLLASRGHDPNRRTLTIWEGVTMYLTEEALDATLATVRSYSAPGSKLAFTYFERWILERPRLRHRLVSRFVRSVGEPFRFGWNEGELEPWLKRRELQLVYDRTESELAEELLPREAASLVGALGRHVAVAAV